MAEATPIPSLTYKMRRPGASVVGEDGPALSMVYEVTTYSGREFMAWARGPMLCKNGRPGPSRSLRVDRFRHRQPDWLAAVLADALRRLEDK